MRSVFGLLIPVFLVSLLLTGCGGNRVNRQWAVAEGDWVAPPPPEIPRIQFLRQVSGHEDVFGETRQRTLFNWISGEKGPEVPLVSPYGVAADGRGRIWLADPGSGIVHAIDLANKKIDYISAFDGRQLVTPVGVLYDTKQKKLYISDAGLLEVVSFDEEYRYLGSLKPATGFKRPAGLALDPSGRLLVADVLAGEIEVFTADGQPHGSLGSALTPSGRFNRPANLAVDPEGRIYVVDSMNFRVEVLGLPGESPVAIGGIGGVPGTFARPRGIALDSQGHIYVSDAAFDNVQIFDRSGALLLYFGSPEKGLGQLCMPAGMIFDAADRLYVADSCGYRVKIFQYLKE